MKSVFFVKKTAPFYTFSMVFLKSANLFLEKVNWRLKPRMKKEPTVNGKKIMKPFRIRFEHY